MSPVERERGDFSEFRAQTRLEIAHLREMLQRIMPMHEQRSGDRAEIAAIHKDMAEIKTDVSEVRKDVGALKTAQMRMLAILFALQVIGGVLMWLLNAGVIHVGASP